MNSSDRESGALTELCRLVVMGALLLLIGSCGGGGSDKPQQTVTWNPGAINVTVVQGTTQSRVIEINVGDQVNDVSLVIGPEIAGVMQASLLGNAVIKPGSAVRVVTEVTVPVATPPGIYEGTVAVRSGTGTLPTALTVKIQVVPGSSSQVVTEVADPSLDRIARTSSGQFLIRDEVLVVIDQAVTDPQTRIQAIAAQFGAVIIGSVPGLPVYQLRIPGADESTIDAKVDAIATLPGVETASPSLLGTGLNVLPEEGLYKGQWNSANLADGPNRHLEFIHAPEAWNVTTGSNGEAAIPVAVIDDDFDFEHPDLIGNIDGIHPPGDPFTFPAWFGGGHGTAVAGAICAKGTMAGGIGVVGVAWNCKLRLYSAKGAWPANEGGVFKTCLSVITNKSCFKLLSLPRAIESMKRAVIDGARIVNMSIGFIESDCGTPSNPPCTDATKLAKLVKQVNGLLVKGIEQDTEKKVLWVFAAGNEGRDASVQSPASLKAYPQFADRIIVVAGAKVGEELVGENLTDTGKHVPIDTGPFFLVQTFKGSNEVLVSGGSNFGSSIVDVAAPWYVSTTFPRKCDPYPDGCEKEPIESFGSTSYVKEFGGTSAAAPQVAGLAVLVMSANPKKSAAEVKACIVDSARNSGRVVLQYDSSKKGYVDSGISLIHAAKAVECAPPAAPTIQADPQDMALVAGQVATFNVTATGTNLTYQWRIGSVSSSVPAPGATNGPVYTIPSAALADNGSTYFVIVSNSVGGTTSGVATLTVTAAATTPAVTVQPRAVTVNVGQLATFSVTATGANLTYEWRKGSATSNVAAPGATNSPTYTTPATTLADNGSTYFVIVSNSAVPVTSSPASLTVLPAPPGDTQAVMTATPDPARPGGYVQYAVTVTNTLSTGTYIYTVNAQVPDHTTVPAGSTGQGGSCNGVVNGACPAGGMLRWSLYIGPGQSVTLPFTALVDTTNPPPNGTVIRSTATASSGSGGASAGVDVVVSTTDLSLGMVNGPSPVIPGGVLSYTLRFGNPGGTSSPAAVLTASLPPGTTFATASDGGTVVGGVVQWNVGVLAPGAAGQRQMVVLVDALMSNGSVVNAAADLRDASTGRSLARANAAAAVLTHSDTQAVMTATPDPVRPGGFVQYAVTVTNTLSTGTYIYTVNAQVPDHTTVPAGSTGQGGSCNGVVNGACPAGGTLRWSLYIGPGQSVTLPFAALVDTTNPPSNGTVIRSTATASSGSGGASAGVDVLIGP